MTLEFIRTDACPVCGCRVVTSETVQADGLAVRRHCNGGAWETRTFACGYRTEYVPNYGKEERGHACGQDPELLARTAKQKALKETVLAAIEAGDAPEAYKNRLTDALKYL